MKATGIVRRIDDLGRIVIPKEIRKILKIKEGMPLEIYTESDGTVILKKFFPMGESIPLAEEYAKSIAEQTGDSVILTDREKVIAVAGRPKKGLIGEQISKRLEEILDDRNEQISTSDKKKYIPIIDNMTEEQQIFYPIRKEGEIVGSLFLQPKTGTGFLSSTTKNQLAENPQLLETKIAALAAEFLGKQMNG